MEPHLNFRTLLGFWKNGSAFIEDKNGQDKKLNIFILEVSLTR
jgi:hypothetical protein